MFLSMKKFFSVPVSGKFSLSGYPPQKLPINFLFSAVTCILKFSNLTGISEFRYQNMPHNTLSTDSYTGKSKVLYH